MKNIKRTLMDYISEELSKLGNFITLYHGTRLENGLNLIENGWKPSEGRMGGNIGQPKYLYLTSEPENALWYSNENGGDVIIEINNIPIDYLRPDPEDEAGYTMSDLLERMKRTKLPSNFVLIKPLTSEHFNFYNS